MPTTKPDKSEVQSGPTVLLTGAFGYVGGRLLPLLEQQSVVVRCLARKADKLRPLVRSLTEVVRGDVLDPSSPDAALQGVQTAYYPVHLMSGSADFEQEDVRQPQGRGGRSRAARGTTCLATSRFPDSDRTINLMPLWTTRMPPHAPSSSRNTSRSLGRWMTWAPQLTGRPRPGNSPN